MSCPSFEGKIARLIGEDLAPGEIRAVEEHLRQCATCAKFARLLEQDREWLRSRPPEVAAMDYAGMHSQIRHAIGRRRGAGRWAWLLAAAAAILMALGVGMMRRAPRQSAPVAERRPAAVAGPPVTAGVPAMQTAPARVPARHARVRAPRNTRKDITLEEAMRTLAELDQSPMSQGSDSPVEMLLSTSDPHVTIILLQESQGGSYE